MNRQARRKLAKAAPAAEIARAYQLLQRGQSEAASSVFNQLLRAKAGDVVQAEAHRGLGAIAHRQQDERAAAQHFHKAVQAAPGYAAAWADWGVALAMLGDLKAAEAALIRAVALAPEMGDAQRHLAALRGERAGAEDVAALRARAMQPSLPEDDRIEMLYALGRYADARGAYDDAFRHFNAANGLARDVLTRRGIRFDRGRLQADIDRIIATFATCGGELRGSESDLPVFIVGMPRSGSSLFEQIAASHSEVQGAGEVGGIGAIAARLGWAPNVGWTQAALAKAAGDYLAALSPASRIIDKMPDNIFQLGLITALFPNARVIFCARDRRDVALSCYFQRFAQPLGFDTDLADCMFRIGQIERLTAHWLRVLPLRHMVLSYEALLEAPEGESRRLIEFLGLAWEPACLDFHKTERVVRTASWAQVRRPLYQHAAGRWRHYAAYLPE